jgi:hypothetical protein
VQGPAKHQGLKIEKTKLDQNEVEHLIFLAQELPGGND